MRYLFADINECDEGTDDCDDLCIDTDGSYTCLCDGEFRRASDEKHCICKQSY